MLKKNTINIKHKWKNLKKSNVCKSVEDDREKVTKREYNRSDDVWTSGRKWDVVMLGWNLEMEKDEIYSKKKKRKKKLGRWNLEIK